MKALILGITGFAGPFLAANLLQNGFSVCGTDFKGVPFSDPELDGVKILSCDITDRAQTDKVISDTSPDRVFLLAGFTSPRLSFRNPAAAFAINTVGTANVVASCKALCPGARLLFVSTGNFYAHGGGITITEASAPELGNPYAISKFAAEQYVRMETETSGFHGVVVRPFNHTGPGQAPLFAVPSFAAQILEARKQEARPAVIQTGNTDTYRDFTDVRDTVEAYRLCLEKGRPGRIYNIASGRAVKIRDMLADMLAQAGLHARLETDPERCMPEPEGDFAVDTSLLANDTGWKTQVPLARTIGDIFTWLETGKRSLTR